MLGLSSKDIQLTGVVIISRDEEPFREIHFKLFVKKLNSQLINYLVLKVYIYIVYC